MKSVLITTFFLIGMVFMSHAQYKTALGLGIDSGNGATFVGPSLKHAFTTHHVGQAEVGFESGVTAFTALYQYHGQFEGANGLQWFAGGGVTLFSVTGDSVLGLRGTLGLDYKIDGAPIALSLDWRPVLILDSDIGNTFDAGFLGFGARYVF